MKLELKSNFKLMDDLRKILALHDYPASEDLLILRYLIFAFGYRF
jgi:hypothetical protein